MLVHRDKLIGLRAAIRDGVPFAFEIEDIVGMINMALLLYDADELVRRAACITLAEERAECLLDIAKWFNQFNLPDPQAPCTANALGERDPESSSHKEEATPAVAAVTDASDPPGKSTDDAPLPVQPAGRPLSRDERDCAAKLADAAERMVKTFQEHLDTCSPCAINWQTLRSALGQWQSVTK